MAEESKDLSIALPTELVERAVRDKISASIASSLGDPTELIEKMVGVALNKKVNDRGNVSNSSYENKHSFLEVIAGNFIRSAAEDALKEYFKENEAAVKDAVKKQVAKSPAKIAKILVDGMTGSLDCRYRNSVTISFQSLDD